MINDKFPLETQFLIIDFISEHEIRKLVGEKAVLEVGIDTDFQVDENDSYDEDDDSTEEEESEEDNEEVGEEDE